MPIPLRHRQIRYNFTDWYNRAIEPNSNNDRKSEKRSRSKVEQNFPRIIAGSILIAITVISTGITINRGLICWAKYV